MTDHFSADTATDWQQRIIKELKGKPLADLISQTREGIEIQPFYTRGESSSVLGLGPQAPWRIRQEFLNDDSQNNAYIHQALMAGVDSITVSAQRMDEDLKDVNIEMIEVEVTGDDFHPLWIEEVTGRGLDFGQVSGGYAWDPLGGMLISGEAQGLGMIPIALQIIASQAAELPNWYSLNINGDEYHNAGATAVQELAYSLAQANAYFKQDSSLASACAMTLASGTDYFETLAKLKAMRILWANLMRAHKQTAPCRLFARSATKDLAPVDTHSNLLRTTAQAMAAVAGGAERVTLHPFDGAGDAFSYRMARNIQQLLIHESYMDKALNPAEGAYLFESLTTAMAEQAWELFKSIEASGGWAQQFESGELQAEIHQSASGWAKAINSGEQTWLGVNVYPDAEQPKWTGIEVVQEGLALPYFKNTIA